MSDFMLGSAASTLVTAATTFIVSKMATPKTAALVSTVVLVIAHRMFDEPVARRIRSALTS